MGKRCARGELAGAAPKGAATPVRIGAPASPLHAAEVEVN